MSTEKRKSVKPIGARPGIMYGVFKTDKQQVDGSTQLKILFNLMKKYVSKTLHYLWLV